MYFCPVGRQRSKRRNSTPFPGSQYSGNQQDFLIYTYSNSRCRSWLGFPTPAIVLTFIARWMQYFWYKRVNINVRTRAARMWRCTKSHPSQFYASVSIGI